MTIFDTERFGTYTGIKDRVGTEQRTELTDTNSTSCKINTSESAGFVHLFQGWVVASDGNAQKNPNLIKQSQITNSVSL